MLALCVRVGVIAAHSHRRLATTVEDQELHRAQAVIPHLSWIPTGSDLFPGSEPDVERRVQVEPATQQHIAQRRIALQLAADKRGVLALAVTPIAAWVVTLAALALHSVGAWRLVSVL